MTRHPHRVLKSMYGFAIVAVLGFGIKEATATPSALTAKAAFACTWSSCTEYCDSMGWSYDYAWCGPYGCECRIRMCGNAPC
jgi:hypothetical protein